ncbi:type III secretion system protein, YscS/HrpO family [Desulfosarcina variabilis str. Montpellier]|uniref:type III secretion system export apparatus subunit SctS n=1 Tax=Desulfosarcina variabilis TaxID=2300 RepID=UPI003AFB4305
MDARIAELTYKALILVLVVSLPPIIVASLVAVAVSVIQAVTQIQDQTISFAFKLISVTITLIFTVRWLGGQVLIFAANIFDNIPYFVQ